MSKITNVVPIHLTAREVAALIDGEHVSLRHAETRVSITGEVPDWTLPLMASHIEPEDADVAALAALIEPYTHKAA